MFKEFIRGCLEFAGIIIFIAAIVLVLGEFGFRMMGM